VLHIRFLTASHRQTALGVVSVVCGPIAGRLMRRGQGLIICTVTVTEPKAQGLQVDQDASRVLRGSSRRCAANSLPAVDGVRHMVFFLHVLCNYCVSWHSCTDASSRTSDKYLLCKRVSYASRHVSLQSQCDRVRRRAAEYRYGNLLSTSRRIRPQPCQDPTKGLAHAGASCGVDLLA
jgi:hypothetical protein